MSGVKVMPATEVASDDWRGWSWLQAAPVSRHCMHSVQVLADVSSARVYIAAVCGCEIMCLLIVYKWEMTVLHSVYCVILQRREGPMGQFDHFS